MTDAQRFMKLFSGLETSYGTGKGAWVHEPPTEEVYAKHLAGEGDGLGIAPLRTDATVSFAAIDLDEPDFDTATTLASLLPGASFIETSRSGNAHVWAFFSEPIEAWVPRGIMREATAAVGKKTVEVFPKQDKLRIGMVGNYINLPYFGDTRLMLNVQSGWKWTWQESIAPESVIPLPLFLDIVEREGLNDPKDWRKRAHWLGVPTPDERAAEGREFGTQSVLHMCAEHVLTNREENPVVEGHRAVVFFALSKMFANCNQYNSEEALAILGLINDASPDPVSEGEIKRIYFNAERGQFTSTGCDDPLFSPYAHPECPIANGKSN